MTNKFDLPCSKNSCGPLPRGRSAAASGGRTRGATEYVWRKWAGTSGATGGGTSHTHALSGSPALSGTPSISGAPAVTGQTFTGTSHNHTQDAHSHTSGGTFTGTAHTHVSGAFTGTAHTHTGGAFTGTAINLAVSYVDAIIASKD